MHKKGGIKKNNGSDDPTDGLVMGFGDKIKNLWEMNVHDMSRKGIKMDLALAPSVRMNLLNGIKNFLFLRAT